MVEGVDSTSLPAAYPQGFSITHFENSVVATVQGLNQWRALQIIGEENGGLLFRVNTSGTPAQWSGMYRVTTATPPQEYDLPLAAGVNRIRKTYYIKKQNGRAQVHFCVSFQASGFRAVTIGTLPAGYRPSETETDTCIATEAEVDVMGPATVEVLDNGTVQVYGNKPGLIGATGSIEFAATH